MDIRRIDKNFDTGFTPPEDIEWFSVNEQPFSVHGVYYSEVEGLFRRLPKEVADAVNDGVSHLSKNTAGGRVRFATDSPYIAVRAEEPFEKPVPHLTVAGKCGVTLFTNRQYEGTVMPSYDQLSIADEAHGGNGIVTFDGIKRPYCADGNVYRAELFLPLYSAVTALYVGLKKGCTLEKAAPYKYTRPVLFYGSSITQGGCASKPGDDYISRLSRMIDTDFVNLGFSGSAKAEAVMVEYIAEQKPSVFVLDYDHNAPDAEHLKNTHYAMYEAVRKKNPNTPIIMMTMPTVEGRENRPWHKARREEILKSFERACTHGDKNVYLIDCYGCFGSLENGECGTVDGTHPDSLGFLRMAERVYPVLDRLLKGGK